MGTKIIDLKPIHGFAAETERGGDDPGGLAPGPAGLDDARHQRGDHGRRLEPAGLGGALGGDGADPWAWVLTIPISAAVAWVCYWAFDLSFGH